MSANRIRFRREAVAADRSTVRRLVRSTGVFSPVEVKVAVQLLDDRLANGRRSEFRFLFAEQNGRTLGYACYGPIPLTAASFDLYWIVVDKALQGRGLGKLLLERTEELIRRSGGLHVYAETSGRPQYAPTRGFYRRCGYVKQAVFPDFYSPGDAKIVYVKQLLSDR